MPCRTRRRTRRSSTCSSSRRRILRYGENPHQSAAFYREPTWRAACSPAWTQLQGKELSYNNIADADAAWECVKSFTDSAALRHRQARQSLRRRGWRRAWARPTPSLQDRSDSAFGGIIAFNAPLDGRHRRRRRQAVVEVLIAPEVTPEARAVLAAKPNVRLLEVPLDADDERARLQARRRRACCCSRPTAATSRRRAAGRHQAAARRRADDDLLFAWKVAKFVKSNAIVFCAAA
jgi:phosphoribosylaminoimidazolecarboxamide formyltransferase/IMP cyclohydrolase